MRSRRLLLAPLLLATLAPLAVGCTSNSSASDGAGSTNAVVPPASKADVHTIDWRNASYSVGCLDLGGPANQQVPVTLTNGAGATAPVNWFGSPIRLDVAVKSVSYGDLTGDGRDEAVVDLTCTPAGSNGVAQEIQVFGPGSELLGTPALRNSSGSDFAPAIETLSVANGHITGTALVWAASDPHCCPSQTLPFTFTWNAEKSAFDQS